MYLSGVLSKPRVMGPRLHFPGDAWTSFHVSLDDIHRMTSTGQPHLSTVFPIFFSLFCFEQLLIFIFWDTPTLQPAIYYSPQRSRDSGRGYSHVGSRLLVGWNSTIVLVHKYIEDQFHLLFLNEYITLVYDQHSMTIPHLFSFTHVTRPSRFFSSADDDALTPTMIHLLPVALICFLACLDFF